MSYAQSICNIHKISEHMQEIKGNFVDESGNIPRRSVVPKISVMPYPYWKWSIRYYQVHHETGRTEYPPPTRNGSIHYYCQNEFKNSIKAEYVVHLSPIT